MPEVYLSPSTRDFNRGYGTFGTEEERMNLIADVVELELVRNGVTTVRNNPAYNLQTLVSDANSRGSDIYVAIRSVFCDAGERGARVFYYRPGSNGQRLADAIYAALSEVTPTEDRGLMEGSSVFGGLGFYELRRSRMPAVIVEVGCHSNPQDADFIVRNVYQLGVAIARGILEYFDLPFTPDTAESQMRLENEYNNVYF
ncbi:MAG: N-acetylmuramoyl-L-alanine amidase [Clostridia bacterium]|nr:N-acetylmuramoyl-L-alanine amidase [Clostridia bacterium]